MVDFAPWGVGGLAVGLGGAALTLMARGMATVRLAYERPEGRSVLFGMGLVMFAQGAVTGALAVVFVFVVTYPPIRQILDPFTRASSLIAALARFGPPDAFRRPRPLLAGAARVEASGRDVCLLIVDADAIFLLERLLRRTLRPEDLPDILTAPSPREALAWLFRLTDCGGLLVVSDYDLRADHTGIDLLGFIAHDRPGSIRVLMSGSPIDALPRLDAHPIHDFIPKDTPRDEIARRLTAWLQRARAQP